jgi:predicted DNA-binding transcriptional regulator YafY
MEARYDGRWYRLSPMALVWDDEKYYLVGYDEKYDSITHYRVDKMMEIRITNDERIGKKEFLEFNLAHYTNALFGMYTGDETKVILEGENHMVGVLIDRFGKDIIIVPVDEEHFRTSVTVAVSTPLCTLPSRSFRQSPSMGNTKRRGEFKLKKSRMVILLCGG